MKFKIDKDLIDLFYEYNRELLKDEVILHNQAMIAASNLVLAHLQNLTLFGIHKFENVKLVYKEDTETDDK